MPPLSGSDDWNENDISNFDPLSDSKKPKLSDSSLHRVTPDSGIALHYQSSVSSVGSLSPSIEKASSGGEDSTATNTTTSNGKGFPPQTGFEEVVTDANSTEKRSRHMSELRSDVASMSLKKPSTNGDSISPYGSPTPSHKGTIPLSHAPPMAHQQPLMHVNTAQIQPQGVSPGGNGSLIHSSSMVHSPAHNSAFPFNPSTQMGHHHPFNPSTHPAAAAAAMYHHPSTYPMGTPRPHNSLFPHAAMSQNPFAPHPSRSAPPYESLPSAAYPHQPHSSLQHSPYSRQPPQLYNPQQSMTHNLLRNSTDGSTTPSTAGYPTTITDSMNESNGSINNRNDPSTPSYSDSTSLEVLTSTATTSANNDQLPTLSAMDMDITTPPAAAADNNSSITSSYHQNDNEEGCKDEQEIQQQTHTVIEEEDSHEKIIATEAAPNEGHKERSSKQSTRLNSSSDKQKRYVCVCMTEIEYYCMYDFQTNQVITGLFKMIFELNCVKDLT